VVLREAVQNSWDARQGDKPVEFEIRWWQPTKEQKAVLRDTVFANEAAKSPVRQEIPKQDFDMSVFNDRGTRRVERPRACERGSFSGREAELRGFRVGDWTVERRGAGGRHLRLREDFVLPPEPAAGGVRPLAL
jgi:hypothetical protein